MTSSLPGLERSSPMNTPAHVEGTVNPTIKQFLTVRAAVRSAEQETGA